LRIHDIVNCLEEFAPSALQESWDNSGLITGNLSWEASSALVSLDVTEAVVDEAIAGGENLIIAHHPFIFSALKKVTGRTEAERILIKAIKHDIAIYAAHTSIDVVNGGVSYMMARKLGLENVETLSKTKELLKKMAVYVPVSHATLVRDAMFSAGAGHVGNYRSCSFNAAGRGTFMATEAATPYLGSQGEFVETDEVKIETVFPFYLQSKVISAMLGVHPYEEVAYDVIPLDNQAGNVGLGVAGYLSEAVKADVFLSHVKDVFGCEAVKYAGDGSKDVRKIALCGGAGSSLIAEARQAGADLYLTGDIKYHQFFEADNSMVIADIGHYESEQFTKELFLEIVTNKFSKFAIRLSNVQTNPVKYLF